MPHARATLVSRLFFVYFQKRLCKEHDAMHVTASVQALTFVLWVMFGAGLDGQGSYMDIAQHTHGFRFLLG